MTLICAAGRSARLAKLLARAPECVVYSDHPTDDGAELFRRCGELGGEGIVSKRVNGHYTSGPAARTAFALRIYKCPDAVIYTILNYRLSAGAAGVN